MLKNILKVVLSNFLGAGLGFLVNVLLARVMTVADYGQYNFIVSIILILFTIGEFGFGNSLVIYYNKYKKDTIDTQLINNINSVFVRFLGSITVLLLILIPLTSSKYSLSLSEQLCIFISSVTFILYRYCLSFEQANGHWAKYNFLNLLNNLVKASVYIIALTFIYINLAKNNTLQLSYESAIISYAIYSSILGIFAVFYSIRTTPISTTHSNEMNLKKFWNYLWPIGLSNVCVIISMRFDPLILKFLLGETSVGYYSVANSFAMMFPLITGAIMNVLLTEIAGNKLTLKSILKRQKQFIPHIILVLLIAYVLCKPVILFLFGENYAPSIGLFRLLLIAFIGGVFFTPLESYFYSNRIKVVLKIRTIQVIAIIILSYVFVKSFGLIGVGISAIISRSIAWIYFLFLSCRKVN